MWVLYGAPWLALVVLVALWWQARRRLIRLETRQRRLFDGADVITLDAALDRHLDRVQAALEATRGLEEEVLALQSASQRAVQHVGVVRFNPFFDTGGDQSFALALADARGNGVVICNLHGRGESRLYAKPLEAWRSAYALSEEEELAVNKARGAIDLLSD